MAVTDVGWNVVDIAAAVGVVSVTSGAVVAYDVAGVVASVFAGFAQIITRGTTVGRVGSPGCLRNVIVMFVTCLITASETLNTAS